MASVRTCNHCSKEAGDDVLFCLSIPVMEDNYLNWEWKELCFVCLRDLCDIINPWLMNSEPSAEESSKEETQ